MEEEWLRNLRADDAVPEDPTPVPDDPLEEIGEILASMSKVRQGMRDFSDTSNLQI
jgi:hypothetical protein